MIKIIFISILFLVFISPVKADVAPDAGYTRVSVNLILETREDFPEYRFFLDSPMEIEEIFVKKSEVLNIDTTGRAGAKRIATVLAIPRASLAQFGENLSAEKLEELQKAIQERKVDGIIKILNHSFQRDIPLYEKIGWENPKYRIERDTASVIKAVPIGKGKVEFGMTEQTTGIFWLGTIAAGILFSLAVLILGVWLFRKRTRKS